MSSGENEEREAVLNAVLLNDSVSWRKMADAVKAMCVSAKEAAANRNSSTADALDRDLRSLIARSLTLPLFEEDYSGIAWCKWLIAGGEDPEQYFEKISHYDNSITCGLVWSPSFIAYRCRTCGLSPGTSICPKCFNAANHKDHDFNMFKSQDGGACDCGDVTVMKEIGFCPRHGPKSAAERAPAPAELFYVAEYLLPFLIPRLLFSFREWFGKYKGMNDFRLGLRCPFDPIVEFFQKLSDCGSAMKRIMAASLIDPDLYESIIRIPSENDSEHEYRLRLRTIYEQMLDQVQSILNKREVESFDCVELLDKLHHESILDEIIFWLIPAEFPLKVVLLLLSLMSEETFKTKFADSFVKHYSYMAMALTKTGASQSISNRVLHMTVQLFSSEAAANRLVNSHHLLHTLMFSLTSMIHMCLMESRLNNEYHNFHLVVNCNSSIMVNHSYWPLISDMQCLISHESVALQFLRDPLVLHLWCNVISCCQGMNPNYRQLHRHVEFESRSFLHAFTAEIELCGGAIWTLLQPLKSPDTKNCVLSVLQMFTTALEEWFANIDLPNRGKAALYPFQLPRLELSFHIPLHRVYAAFMSLALKQDVSVIMPSQSFLRLLMLHPLQIQVGRCEIASNMWVRNGTSMRHQSCFYVQSHSCSSLVDLDYYILQLCGSQLDPDFFTLTIFDRFQTLEWLSFSPGVHAMSFLRPEWATAMIEGALRLIASLVTNTVNLGANDYANLRLELAALLAMENKTYSELSSQVPDKCVFARLLENFDVALAELADYNAPGVKNGAQMTEGLYTPKDVVWEQLYDSLHIILRSFQMNQFHNSMEHYAEYVKKRTKSKKVSATKLWPPMRLPYDVLDVYRGLRNILHCRCLHAIIYVALYKHLNDISSLSDATLFYCVYLLWLATQFPLSSTPNSTTWEGRAVTADLQFRSWFPGNNLFVHLCHRIDKVLFLKNLDSDTISYSYLSFPDLISFWDEEKAPSATAGSTTSASSCWTEDIPFIDSSYHNGVSRENWQPFTSNEEIIDCLFSSEDRKSAAQRLLLMSLIPSLLRGTRGTERPKRFAVQEERSHSSSTVPSVTVIATPAVNDTRPEVPIQALAASAQSQSESTSNESADKPTLVNPEKMEVQAVDLGESLLSLLIKLHNKLSGKCYEPPRLPSATVYDADADAEVAGFGDGPHAIRRLLNQICALDNACLIEVTNICGQLSQQRGSFSDSMSLAKKKQLAKERQERVMAQFAAKQQAVMSHYMQTDPSSNMGGCSGSAPVVEENSDDVTMSGEKAIYECVICDQVSSSSLERPICLVASAQSTSILRKCTPAASLTPVEGPSEDRAFQAGETRGSADKSWSKMKSGRFSKLPCTERYHFVGCNSVYIQSCGHSVHADCLEAYRTALKSDQRHRNTTVLEVQQGEFLCPLCRQTSNFCVPVLPTSDDHPCASTDHSVDAMFAHLSSLLECTVDEVVVSQCSQAATNIFDCLRRFNDRLPFSEYFGCGFFCNLIRLNLELTTQFKEKMEKRNLHCMDLVLQFASGLLPIFHVAEPSDIDEQVCLVTGVRNRSISPPTTTGDQSKRLPLLMTDLQLALVHAALLFRRNSRCERHFRALCQAFWNPLVIQLCLGEFFQVRPKQEASQVSEAEVFKHGTLKNLLQYFMRRDACSSPSFSFFHPMTPAMKQDHLVDFLLQNIAIRAIGFLRVAAMLKCLVTGATLPVESVDDFEALKRFCLLCDGDEIIKMHSMYGPTALDSWIAEVKHLRLGQPVASVTIYRRAQCWLLPKLIDLPDNFETFFQMHYNRECDRCGTRPRETLICLSCGRLVCHLSQCCKTSSLTEVEQHRNSCGAGTSVYLSVQTSVVSVVRGRRVCEWGSLYLDSHGEEDRELKRGRPLFLSKERYQLLQHQWLSHSFDISCRHWYWLMFNAER